MPVGDGSYEFSILAGQTTYVGTCIVTVTGAVTTIGSCQIVSGWYATGASFYISNKLSTSCSPGTFGKQTLLTTFAPTTGSLNVTGSFTNTSPSKEYIMIHFNVGQ